MISQAIKFFCGRCIIRPAYSLLFVACGLWLVAACSLPCLPAGWQLLACSLFAAEVKEPNVAGMFYPDDPEILSSMVDGFLTKANPEKIDGDIFVIVVPHAGYGFSGQVAAVAYKLIKEKPYTTVIIIGTGHHYGVNGLSVYAHGVFRTPLGDIEIDQDFTQKLLNKDARIVFEPKAFDKEHSLEVQLPFLQRSLVNFKIVPLIAGDCTLETCQALAGLLKEAIGVRKDVLLVVSTDMYHGYDFEEAERVDAKTLSYLKDMDAEGLYYGLREGTLQLCGGFGAVSALFLAKELGRARLQVLAHTNSSIVTGKKVKGIWTVGYSSSCIDRKEDTQQTNGVVHMLNGAQRKRLLEIARGSIETYLSSGKKLQVKEDDLLLNKHMGAFVTLHTHGELRGCIGNLIGSQPLFLTIRDMAIESATADPRFPAVKLEELNDITIEISVLSLMEKIDSIDKIQLGVHGVLIKRGFQSGVFLPQVATETGWSKEEFLSMLCSQKAGLAPDAWKQKDTEMYIFSAEVFSEKE